MELLTRNNFEDWMQKLMERLDRQDELLLSLRPSGKAPNPMESIRMFDNQDLCMLLQISKRTLQRYRSIGALPYKTLGKKTYYSEEDVPDIPLRTRKGFPQGRYSLLQGAYP